MAGYYCQVTGVTFAADLASLFDPLPFEEDGETDVDEATGSADDTSPLSAALAEAMAEA